MPIHVIPMDADLKQAILECLAHYYNHVYDGSPEPGWVDTMIGQYAADDGVTDWRDAIEYMQREIAEYKES